MKNDFEAGKTSGSHQAMDAGPWDNSALVKFREWDADYASRVNRAIAAANDGYCAVSESLPRAAWHHDLGPHSGREIGPQRDDISGAVAAKEQHLHGITHVEMKHLVAAHAMDRGEVIGRGQIVDRGRERSRSGITL